MPGVTSDRHVGGAARSPVGGQAAKLIFHRLSERSSPVLGPAETVAQLRAESRTTSLNVGNLVHLEALAKILRYNRRASLRFRGDTPEALAVAERQFDGIVLGYANIIRSIEGLESARGEGLVDTLSRDADWLETTRLPIYALGLGLQDPLPPRADAIDPQLFRLLRILNDKAKLFAVRGEETRDWLHAVGLTNAVALGCPSMFVYPRNVLGIAPLDARAPRIATAGRLQRNRELNRIEPIDRIGAAMEASYVFQNDFFISLAVDPDRRIHDDATGSVDRAAILPVLREILGFVPSFRDYWLFRSTEKWRGFASGKDAYFGDRFHGGVVFAQCGKPAVIVRNDLRVAELTDFHGLPSATPVEILESDPVELLHARAGPASLARFHETYRVRYAAFRDTLRGAGLELFNDVAAEDL